MRKSLLCIFLALSVQVNAQVISDALRLSNQNYTSTARATGLLGTMSNLGGDQYAIYSNPAGLATFRKSQLTITPGYSNNSTNSSFEGNEINQSIYHLSLDNLGLVTARKRNNKRWKTINFGVTYNKLADFNQDFEFEGSSIGSISDRWKENATGQDTSDFSAFEEGLAAEAGVLFIIDEQDKTYGTDYDSEPNKNEKLYKTQSVQTTGYMGEINIAFAGNLEEKLQIGGSFGIRLMEYNAFKKYNEDGLANPAILGFRTLSFEENIFTTGTGLNINIGLIYKPTKALRISGAIHSPTFWTLSDNYYNDLEYSYTDENDNTFTTKAESPEGIFKYDFKNPLRLNGGVAFIVGKNGFISGEIEWTDYRKSIFNLTKNSNSSDDRSYQNLLNSDIKDAYSSTINYKVGAEYAFNSIRLRGAYALRQRPYANDNKFDPTYAFGIGMNENNFFLDVGFSWYKESTGYTPYLIGDMDRHQLQIINNISWISQTNITIGFRI